MLKGDGSLPQFTHLCPIFNDVSFPPTLPSIHLQAEGKFVPVQTTKAYGVW
jgi:hypothetical protein